MFKWTMIIIYEFRLPTHATEQTQYIMLQYYGSKSKSLVVPKYVGIRVYGKRILRCRRNNLIEYTAIIILRR